MRTEQTAQQNMNTLINHFQVLVFNSGLVNLAEGASLFPL